MAVFTTTKTIAWIWLTSPNKIRHRESGQASAGVAVFTATEWLFSWPQKRQPASDASVQSRLDIESQGKQYKNGHFHSHKMAIFTVTKTIAWV